MGNKDKDRRDRSPADEHLQGKGEELKGKVQQAWGDLTDDERHQREGKAKAIKGKLRQTKADVEQTIEDVKDRFTS
jgi:uncharacterized protein YjbJ (UPF0337 family)